MLSFKRICLYAALLLALAFNVALCDRFSWLFTLGLQFFLPDRRDPPSVTRRCAANETFRMLGRACGETCGTYGQQCPATPVNRCQCLVGFVRNRRGNCIYYLDCDQDLDIV